MPSPNRRLGTGPWLHLAREVHKGRVQHALPTRGDRVSGLSCRRRPGGHAATPDRAADLRDSCSATSGRLRESTEISVSDTVLRHEDPAGLLGQKNSKGAW